MAKREHRQRLQAKRLRVKRNRYQTHAPLPIGCRHALMLAREDKQAGWTEAAKMVERVLNYPGRKVVV